MSFTPSAPSSEPLLAAALVLAIDVALALTSGRSARAAASARARASRAAAITRRDAKALQAPHTFAACAKLERRALALEREAERLAGVEAAASAGSALARAASAAKLAVFVVLVVRWWGVPVARLPGAAAWPVGRWLASPHGGRAAFADGGVGVLPWIAAVRAASGAAVRGVVAVLP